MSNIGFKGIVGLAVENTYVPTIPGIRKKNEVRKTDLNTTCNKNTNTKKPENLKGNVSSTSYKESQIKGNDIYTGCFIVFAFFVILSCVLSSFDNKKDNYTVSKKSESSPTTTSNSSNNVTSNSFNFNTKSNVYNNYGTNNQNQGYRKYNTPSTNYSSNDKSGGESINITKSVTKNFNSKECVRFVQNFLLYYGYDIGTADGISGNKTKKAIKDVKNRLNIGTDSNIDKQLLKSLVGCYLYDNYGGLEKAPNAELERFYKKLKSFGAIE